MNPQPLNTLLSQWSELEPKVICSSVYLSGGYDIELEFGDFLIDPKSDYNYLPLQYAIQTHITQSGHSLKLHSYSKDRHSVFIGDAVSEQNRESLLEALLMCWIGFLKWERRLPC